MAKKTKHDIILWDKEYMKANIQLCVHEPLVHAAFKIAADWWGASKVDFTVSGESSDAIAIKKATLIEAFATNLIRCHLTMALKNEDKE